MAGRLAGAIALLSLGLAIPSLLAAQIAVPSENPGIRRALDDIKASNAWTLEQQTSICEIPAPGFKEQLRGAELRKRLVALGYANARVDAIGNVVAERPGTGGGPTVMIAGHLDTVFPEGTNVKVKREGDKFSGPGITDDCRGLASLLAVARALNHSRIVTTGRVILVGDVGEEGAGNLRGVRHLLSGEYKGKVDFFISIDGLGLSVVNREVGSKRYNIKFTGPGGHSYGAFGMPSAIHAMGRAIANIGELQVPTTPKTTFNVGVVSGGTSVNTIAGEAAMAVDMRSESAGALDQVEAAIRKAVEQGLAAENARWPRSAAKISVKFDTIGIRPVPSTPLTDESPLVRAALDAARALGEKAATSTGSTDANVAMNLGVPAITIGGGGRGGGAHALNEWYQDGPDGYKGPQWALLIVTALAGLGRNVTP